MLNQSPVDVTVSFEGRVLKRCQKQILALFWDTGSVTARQGDRESAPASQRLTDQHLLELFERLILHPHMTQREHRLHFELERGLVVHKSTICRAVRALSYRRQRVRCSRARTGARATASDHFAPAWPRRCSTTHLPESMRTRRHSSWS